MAEIETVRSNLELERADVYSQYLLHSQAEVVYVLRSAMQKGCMITVYFDMGQSFFLTSLLDVATEGIILDYGSDEEINRRALKVQRLICTTSVDKVKVQFALDGLSLVEHEGRHAFFSKRPDSVLRLQRREYFRVPTPIANPLVCKTPLPAADGQVQYTDLPLLDISAGGLCLMVSTEQAEYFPRGQIFNQCYLDLPEEGQITLDLEACNAFEVTTRTGNRYTRVGCSFFGLSNAKLAAVQRYITKLERERKARISGLE